MKDILLWLYPLSQCVIFLFYVPHLKSVIMSETADAINVLAQFAFFITGAIAAAYMMVVNEDLLATLIIVAHIFTGNLLIGVIALRKQRQARPLSKEKK